VIILVDHDIGPEALDKVTTLCDKQMEITPDLFK